MGAEGHGLCVPLPCESLRRVSTDTVGVIAILYDGQRGVACDKEFIEHARDKGFCLGVRRSHSALGSTSRRTSTWSLNIESHRHEEKNKIDSFPTGIHCNDAGAPGLEADSESSGVACGLHLQARASSLAGSSYRQDPGIALVISPKLLLAPDADACGHFPRPCFASFFMGACLYYYYPGIFLLEELSIPAANNNPRSCMITSIMIRAGVT